jgi:hypothetical protein
MAWTTYDTFLQNQLTGATATRFGTHTIKLKICTSSYTPNRASDSAASDATNEVSGSNYSAGGPAVTCSTSTASNTVSIVAASNVTIDYHASGFSDGQILVLYDSTNDQLIAYEDRGPATFGNDQGDLTINLSAGILDFNPTQ